MNDVELKFPEWQGPVQELLLEFDPQKWNERAKQIGALILERLKHLDHKSDSRDEKIALQDALTVVRVLKRDKLGAPGWGNEGLLGIQRPSSCKPV